MIRQHRKLMGIYRQSASAHCQRSPDHRLNRFDKYWNANAAVLGAAKSRTRLNDGTELSAKAGRYLKHRALKSAS